MTPSPSSPVTGLAEIVALDIRQLEIFPVRIQVIVEGVLPDSCTTIERIDRTRQDDTFRVTLHTVRATGVTCLDTEIPFTETLDMDVVGLSAGTYTVQVNDISGTFTLQVDNVPDESNGVISGRVWHDLCAVTEWESDQAAPLEGCKIGEERAVTADGQMQENEPGLGGIVVNLGEGSCPVTGLGTTITDEAGFYLFSGLGAGTYCISIDLDDAINASLLIPGAWTTQPGEATITLEAADNRDDVNFGWDYQFLPPANDSEGECVDDILFTSDITIPDDTIIAAGETFTKTWELLNNGTCTWGAGYSLVFTAGDQMGSPDIRPLGQTVGPGETIELSITLTAPTEPGNYRGEWKLRNANGVLFGIGVEADDPFWVQIVVE